MDILSSIFDVNKINTLYIISQIVGLSGIVSGAILFQQTTRKRLLMCKLICDTIWIINNLLVGALTGMAVTVVAFFREIVFYSFYKKGKRAPVGWLVTFIAAGILCSVITWKSAFSILPSISSVIAIVSFWQTNPKRTIQMAFIVSVSQLTYNISCFNITGVINELVSLSSLTVNVIRDKMARKSQ